MKFALEIGGEIEKFMLEYDFNQLLGTLIIKVDNEPVKKEVSLFSGRGRVIHNLDIGKQERISVRIEKEAKLLFGQRHKVFINDRLVKTYEG